MTSTQTPPEERAEGPQLELAILELRDELSRSRMREAFWISLVVHIVAVIAIALSPKYLQGRDVVVVATPEQLIADREVTYLDLPPDSQKLTERPKTDIVSDKDRIASSRQPQIDRKTLRDLTDPRPAGVPGTPGMPTPPAPAQPQVAQQQQPSPGQQPAQGGVPQRPPNDQLAKLEDLPAARPNPGAFHSPMSARSALDEAARATAASRAGMGGSGGSFGRGPSASSAAQSQLDILSDTMGVDFGPYLSRVLQNVRTNWYTLIPEVARPPIMKQGKVSIEFAITKEGRVAGMKLTFPSGDSSLDRAAWGGITASNPFPPLPQEFRGNYLALRFHFYYNPERNELH